MTKSVYVATSWKNTRYDGICNLLRAEGYTILDWRKSGPEGHGFAWQQIDPNWQNWTPEQYKKALNHDIAIAGYCSDFDFMQDADFCVMVLPCGKSAHLEAGWFVGNEKNVYILLEEKPIAEPELMYKLAWNICLNTDELLNSLKRWES